MEIRVLRSEEDFELFEQAWSWRGDKPDWWIQTAAVWDITRDSFFDGVFDDSQVEFGIFIENQFAGLIVLQEVKPAIFEAHIDAPRTTALEHLIEATEITREHAFENGAQGIFVFVATVNRPIIKLCEKVGFSDTGVRVLNGKVGKRTLEWRQFAMTP